MAAAVFIPPSPHDPLSRMATAARRAPLASIPNVVNSPHRLLTTSGAKRSRAQANVSRQENEPPHKRQAVEKNPTDSGPSTPTRHLPNNGVEGRVFERGHGASGSTAFQRKLVAARDKSSGLRVTKNVEPPVKDDGVRQWQKHYRKIFPSFSFYFDGVGDDVRARFVRNITLLGAVEEKFFSKSVTHIITTRPIPPELDPTKPADAGRPLDDQPSTINPSLLDKSAVNGPQSRPQSVASVRRDGSLDILQRGRQMGMKIWTADKLTRVLTTVLDDASLRTQQARLLPNTTRPPQAELSQVLRNDKLGTTAERDPTSVIRDLVHFKGPFIYIHDIDERYKPTMVREYPTVARRQDGAWPQFRSAGMGKCPFVEDASSKREMEQARRHKSQQLQLQQDANQVPRTRSTTHLDATKMEPPRRTSPRKALKEVRNLAPPPATINPGLLSKALQRPEPQLSFPPMPEQQTFDFVRPPLMHMPREPAASGIQRSNLTSAIQSQMISSTAVTGVKAGTSKEVHELKRKVLERSHTGSLSIGSIPSSHRMTDLVGALKTARAPAPQRAAKSKAQEKLGGIQEEDAYAEDVAAERAAHAQAKRKKAAQKDPKPGYCENCRDKYDDFEEHIVSRKHRKFATTQSNWTDLDTLLAKLQDP